MPVVPGAVRERKGWRSPGEQGAAPCPRAGGRLKGSSGSSIALTLLLCPSTRPPPFTAHPHPQQEALPPPAPVAAVPSPFTDVPSPFRAHPAPPPPCPHPAPFRSTCPPPAAISSLTVPHVPSAFSHLRLPFHPLRPSLPTFLALQNPLVLVLGPKEPHKFHCPDMGITLFLTHEAS